MKLLGLLQRSQAVSSSFISHQQEGTSTTYTSSPVFGQHIRHIGGDKIPEFWGKPSDYTAGTSFLGTPKDHLQLLNKRPLSPDVLEIDNKSAHYKFPVAALSSIANRVTGVALTFAFAGAGWVALSGDLPGTIGYVATTTPLLLIPMKFLVAYTLVYHYGGGIRHLVWDAFIGGNQAEKKSLLELPAVQISSRALFIGAGAIAAVIALL